MKSIKLALLRHIQENMPDIRTIDEDYGQLEYPSDQYPVFFPAVLIGTEGTEWATESLAPLFQTGTTTVKLRLALECYDDTHAGSTTEHLVEEREAKAEELFNLVQNWRPFKGIQPFCRTKDNEYSLPGGIKVYELTFVTTQRHQNR